MWRALPWKTQRYTGLFIYWPRVHSLPWVVTSTWSTRFSFACRSTWWCWLPFLCIKWSLSWMSNIRSPGNVSVSQLCFWLYNKPENYLCSPKFKLWGLEACFPWLSFRPLDSVICLISHCSPWSQWSRTLSSAAWKGSFFILCINNGFKGSSRLS